MKKNNKKGFTIVELVIVIAVIAILAAVLIPTFASVTDKAKKSAALQEATSAVTAITVYDLDQDAATPEVGKDYVIESNGYFFVVKAGKIETTPVAKDAAYATEFTTEIPDLPNGVKIWTK
jgi:prepilin-type N-terminal cleavage/methylation domain-containing protein